MTVKIVKNKGIFLFKISYAIFPFLTPVKNRISVV